MAITQFDDSSTVRIRQAVKWVESQGSSVVNLNRRTRHRAPPAGDAYLHPWKLWTRDLSGTGQWTVSEQDPADVSGFPTGATAGRFYNPANAVTTIPAPAWANLSGTASIRLRMEVTTLAVSGTISTATTSGTVHANPALLWYDIGTITSGTDGWDTVQKLNGDVDLTGAMVPAWYSGYVSGAKQVFWHASGQPPTWANTCV